MHHIISLLLQNMIQVYIKQKSLLKKQSACSPLATINEKKGDTLSLSNSAWLAAETLRQAFTLAAVLSTALHVTLQIQ